MPDRPRPDDVTAMAGVTLALGGGAALGWAHVGVIRVLEEAGIAIGAVAGTSMGALIGAGYAAGRLDAVEALARTVRRRTILSYLDPSLARGAVLGGRRVMRTLVAHLGRDATFERLAIPFCTVAADLMTGGEVGLTTGPLIPAVRASIAIPFLFRPVAFAGRHLIDGGMVANLPIGAARAIGGGRPVIAVDLFADYAGHAAEVMPDGVPVGGFATGRAGFLMLMAQQARLAARIDPPAVLVAPRIGHRSTGDFHLADELIAAGRVAAYAALPSIRAAVAAQ